MENETTAMPLIQTKIRRSCLGNLYDIYIDGRFRATAYGAREIEPLIEKLVAQ